MIALATANCSNIFLIPSCSIFVMAHVIDVLPFDSSEFADNPEPRCPCVLVLDVSRSMAGKPIDELNAGLLAFQDELAADTLARKRAEIAIVTFGPVKVERNFQTAEDFRAPVLTPQNDTPMGAAIDTALDLLEGRKAHYKQAGIGYYRPWIFLITDGGPTDSWQKAAQRVQAGEGRNFSFFAVAVEGANVEILRQISKRPPSMLKGTKFRELFQWLSSSLKAVSRSQTTDSVKLLNPGTPEGFGWTEIK